MSYKAVVLLSGGQDSTVCLFWAVAKFDEVEAISFRYGQRHEVELKAAAKIAQFAGVKHAVLDMKVFEQIGGSALTSEDDLEPLDEFSRHEAMTRLAEIDGDGFSGFKDEQAHGRLPTSFVPGRNILFLAAAAAFATTHGAKNIVIGACEADRGGYPDCRRSFIQAMEMAVNEGLPSSARPIVIHTPLMYLTKTQTVEMAVELSGCMKAIAYSITCYKGRSPGCGECLACKTRAAGFSEVGIGDPVTMKERKNEIGGSIR